MRSNALKSSLVRLLQDRRIGGPAAWLSDRAGAVALSRKISIGCNYVPGEVRVRVPDRLGADRRFTMRGVGGLDQVARMMWWEGWDGYEKPMPDLFAAFSRGARGVLDVGSYTGFFSLIAATCEPMARVVAFEPFPPARAWLEANVACNHLGDRIRVVPFAVSDQPGEANLFVPTTETGLMETASSLNAGFCGSHLESIRVPVVTLDDFVAEHRCGPIDLIKIDVETLEPRVLAGARRILRDDRPMIFLEVLGPADPAALKAARDAVDYRSGLLRPDGIEWQDDIVADPRNLDHLFCPVEKVEAFEEVAETLGFGSALAAPR